MKLALACVLLVSCGTSSTAPPASSTVSQTSTASPTSTTSHAPPAPLPAGCKAQHTTFVSRCSGVPPEPGEPNGTQTTVCDECLANSDCTKSPGGECQETGDNMCSGPSHLVCKYPDPACGNKICPEREVSPPP